MYERSWTKLRNFLRPFHRMSRRWLALYVSAFGWVYNQQRATDEFLRALLMMIKNRAATHNTG